MLRLLRLLLPLPPPRRRKRSARIPDAVPPDHYAEWLANWAAIWGVPDLPSRVRIVFSQRLRRALGRCSPRTGSIRLNPGLLDAAPEALREVVCHEAAHAAVWLLHGRSARPHGREWKDLMRRAGYEPRVRWAAGHPSRGLGGPSLGRAADSPEN